MLREAGAPRTGDQDAACPAPAWAEADRLAALERYAILDTGREAAFDEVASIAADLLDAPIAVVNFIAADRQWFKAEIGIGVDTLPLDVSVCRHAILQRGITVIPDLTLDRRFDGNPLVHVDGGLRFYAGAALETPDGLPLGTVCVLDTAARPDGIDARQRRALGALAAQTMAHIELRRSEAEARRERARAEKHARRLTLLAEASALLLAARDPAAMMRDLFALVADGFRMEVGFHYRCGDGAGGGLGLVAAAGLSAGQRAAAARIAFGEAVCGLVAARREAMHVTGIQASDAPHAAFLKMLGIDSYYSAPLLAGGALLGTLSFGRRGAPFTPGEIEALGTLAAQAAAAIDRAEAEARLRESEDHYRNAIELDPQTTWTATPDGRLDRVNARWMEWTGTSGLGSSYMEALHPDSRGPTADAWGRSVATGVPYDIEHRMLMRDGSARWIHSRAFARRDAAGRIVKWYGSTEDIHERREAQERLAASEARLRAVVDAAPVGLVFADAGGRITGGNARVEEIVGHPVLPSPDVDGYRAWVGFHADGRQVEGREYPLAKVVMGEADRAELEVLYRRGDGRDAWVRFIASAVRDADGALLGGVVASLDIDAERRAQDGLRRLNAELEAQVAAAVAEREAALARLHEAQKMETIGQLTGGVAHDFNNLLTPIVGGLDMLARRVAGDGRAERLVAGALQSAERARVLVQRLLAFARRQHLETRAVDVGALLGGMMELMERSIGPAVRTRVEVEAGLPPARVDANQLELAILNLALNARDAMPAGGELTIAACGEAVAAGAPDGLAAGGYVRIDVRDTGEGMDAETLRRCVEPFFTSKGVGQGTGLGLSMAHGLAAQSGGALSVRSAPGAGATVTMWLPAAADGVAPGPEERAAPAAGRRRAVLLVDDEALVRESTADMLAEIGHEVRQAGDGAEALALLRAGAAVDVLVTDHLMPGMTGGELARAARALRPDLPVLLITGYARPDGIGGDLPRLAKPFRQAELASRVAELLPAETRPA